MAITEVCELSFDNSFTDDLPADPNTSNRPRQVHEAAYSRVEPKHVPAPRLVAWSKEMAAELEIGDDGSSLMAMLPVLAGNQTLAGMDTHAMAYGGHQFGNWAGQLGDGRAIGLGEIVNSAGARWALQLKGAGPTPYSRTGDGLAVLRSSVREFLCSEAMFHLGVPTTRALSLVLTGDQVMRDMFYDGNADLEQGAVLCRVAPTFVRFGNFQLPASRGDVGLLRDTADHTVRRHFDHLGEPSPQVYAALFEEVSEATAEMVAHWMRVGFVHGVMNTDNMSILGLTIDYGPYGWLEDYDPDWTPNTTDAAHRRYRYAQQPQIAHWNLVQLANALHPIVEDSKALQEIIDRFPEMYNRHYQSMMSAKLGLTEFDADTDDTLAQDLIEVLQAVETDMTVFYRRLADIDLHSKGPVDASPLADAYYMPDQIDDTYRDLLGSWLRRYADRVVASGVDASQRRAIMSAANPKYVLRNYIAQLAIDKADDGDFSPIHDLLDTLRNPYDDQPERETYAEKRPEWARHRAGCSMLSCSS